MGNNIIGIDVGMYGCVAFYDGTELILRDMPIHERNKTKRIDCHALKKIFDELMPVDHAFVEQVNAFGMGASSAYNFGWSCGVVEAILASLDIPFSYVSPMKWKKTMDCPKEKDSARSRASQLLPKFSHNWDLKKHDGRAEAALIALYGFNDRERA